MKKIIFIFSLLIAILTNSSTNVVNAETTYYARNYIVMDSYSHEVLEGKDIHDPYSVASISKIMTAIIALESNKLFNVITVDEVIKTIEGSSLYLSIGDKITILDLVYGLLLRSGNDAAVLIASNVYKDIDTFVEKMNQKAKELGMKNTTFHNPSGLDIFDEGNISSCFDMALLMSYCMENEMFCKIVATRSYKNKIKGVWENKNKLLRQYKYCLGGKTGYTYKAKRTLINCAEKEDQRLIVVTFNCGSDFALHKYMFDKYFDSFYYLKYLDKGDNFIDNYLIYSDRVIGLRLSKEKELKGIKKYYINTTSKELNISFIYNDGEIVNGGSFNCIDLK